MYASSPCADCHPIRLGLTRFMFLFSSQTDWERLVSNLFDDPISENEEFIVKVPSYVSGMDKLISVTPPR